RPSVHWRFCGTNRITDSFRGRKSARFEELKPEDVPLSQAAQTPPTQIWKSIGAQISFVRRTAARGVRLCGDGSVELADASNFRPSSDYLLAGCGPSDSFKNSLRRLQGPASASSGRSLGA